MAKSNFVSTELIDKIKKELIEKTYYYDVKYNIRSKSRWKIIGDVTEALSYTFTGISIIFAFASGFFGNVWLSFVAGCFSTSSLVMLKISSYAVSESKERTEQVNRILKKLGIEEIVDITIDSSDPSIYPKEDDITEI